MNSFAALDRWFDQFLQHLEPSQRRELMRRLGQGLRIRSKDRISQQRDPNGNRFTPRKRDQIGSIKRKDAMFKKIGQQLKIEYSADKASVGFGGRSAQIAKVHQEGKTIRPSQNAKPTKYPIRELVGFSQDDEKWITKTTKDFLKYK
ncbi:phage virion morphogenesis protein [Acinetobacter sp. ANC 3832]|uniref:phage virion morphogenesis protein n=1 Tax=Acinetobacter sp. ANC 3832 TaxID=1977874 RepID=UPI000A356B52|nr:phage virion morphogenesis protein [Acinetobacter sp. ANC 3832]OTG94214.1 phage virion morphogenesis protein [Acinetobacter sp. ANC 3832]